MSPHEIKIQYAKIVLGILALAAVARIIWLLQIIAAK